MEPPSPTNYALIAFERIKKKLNDMGYTVGNMWVTKVIICTNVIVDTPATHTRVTIPMEEEFKVDV